MGVLPAQIALEIILGFDDAVINDELVARCRTAFRAWTNGLFSMPINLPGFSEAPSAEMCLMITMALMITTYLNDKNGKIVD